MRLYYEHRREIPKVPVLSAFRRVFVILVFALTAATALRAAAAEPDIARHGEFPSESLVAAGAARVYRLVVPASIDLNKPAPLVIAFHAMLADNKDLMPSYTRLNDTASKYGFIIAYPNAIGSNWGIQPKKVQADLAFFDALLAKLESDYQIDTNRVFVLGMSNGGYFAQVVGRERSKLIAAVASHSGPIDLRNTKGINAERKFPLLIIHGDRDQIFNVQMARDNRDQYRREGHEVKYVELPGQGHLWGRKFDVNETIWQFFADHPLNKQPAGSP